MEKLNLNRILGMVRDEVGLESRREVLEQEFLAAVEEEAQKALRAELKETMEFNR